MQHQLPVEMVPGKSSSICWNCAKQHGKQLESSELVVSEKYVLNQTAQDERKKGNLHYWQNQKYLWRLSFPDMQILYHLGVLLMTFNLLTCVHSQGMFHHSSSLQYLWYNLVPWGLWGMKVILFIISSTNSPTEKVQVWIWTVGTCNIGIEKDGLVTYSGSKCWPPLP